jgi:hypothetical protein
VATYYAPTRRLYANWSRESIYHAPSRAAVTSWLRTVLAESGAVEARRFRDWLFYLGTYPQKSPTAARPHPVTAP